MKLPEGWPTKEMITAGHFELADPANMINNAVRATAVFKAMYEAAPPSELVKAAEALIRTYDFACKEDGCYASNNDVEALRSALDKLKP